MGVKKKFMNRLPRHSRRKITQWILEWVESNISSAMLTKKGLVSLRTVARGGAGLPL